MRICCTSIRVLVCTWYAGYYGAVAWVDYLVGEMLRKLDSLGQANDTVVITTHMPTQKHIFI